ncbi:MAG: type II secretion system F family protein [Planctomycetaceae bacterium]|jgi:general secretion pathway protein F|nr:type II secretion system F family protein [Planctomycetaceae bacterium]MDG2391593.1 type II secretion system F family protein [Planctomycetaceae bacterium]
MPEFQYDARLASGQQTSGVLTAANEQDALGILSSRQLFPLRVMMSEESVKAAAKSQKRVSNKLLTGFYTKLADLLTAGVPLLRSLQLIIEQTSHSGLKSIIQDINDQVADGTRLAEAMAKHPKTFNDLVLSMVRAGEEGGFLEDVLKRVSSFNEHQEELKSRVVGAMIYPSFLCLAGASIVTVMMVVFVPKFAPIFSRMQDRGELPMATTTLLGFSEFLQSYWLIAIMALVGIGVAAQRWLDTDNGRDKFDMFRLKAWGIGIIVKNLAIARFCRILGTLLHNGVPILQALRIAKDATGNRVLSAAIGEAADNVSSGKSLAEPLRASGQFPKEIMEMISVGEEANNLEQVLINISDNLERQTNRQLDMLVRMVEPLMLLLMAVIVVYIIFALLYPVLMMSGLS